jgi:mannosyltransferase OCH1-like enzyme
MHSFIEKQNQQSSEYYERRMQALKPAFEEYSNDKKTEEPPLISEAEQIKRQKNREYVQKWRAANPEKAKAMEAAREEAKKSSPWIGYASTAYQLAIVVLSASILAVSMGMFWGSFVVAGVGIVLSLNGLYLWF